jgi:NADH-quinone oxidoreductase subunit F
MVFTICGDLRREGVFELPLGSPLRYLVEELAGGPPAGRAIKAIFPGASNTVIVPQQPRRAAGLRLGAAGGFGPGRGRVRGVRRLGLHGAGGLPVLAIPVRGVMRAVPGLQVRDRRGHQTLQAGAGAGSDRDLELILVRARGSTGGQKCALPTGESLLLQSLVQGFQAEFASHIGRSCPLPRELPFHKLVDWDAAAGRFAYDLAMHKQPDWTYPS